MVKQIRLITRQNYFSSRCFLNNAIYWIAVQYNMSDFRSLFMGYKVSRNSYHKDSIYFKKLTGNTKEDSQMLTHMRAHVCIHTQTTHIQIPPQELYSKNVRFNKL